MNDSPLQEVEILDRIREGKLLVCTITGTIWKRPYPETQGWYQAFLEKPTPVRNQKIEHKHWFFAFKHRGKVRKVAVHRAVWIAASGLPIPKDVEVDHIDGNVDHNWIANLRLATRSENEQAKYQTIERVNLELLEVENEW